MIHPLNILIADDDSINQVIVQRMLKKLGIMTDVVSDGLEAISALEEQSYDIVLMDIQMPKMNGIEATKVICERWPQRPKIIIVSDCAPNLYRDLCFDAGATEFLAKPVKIKEICTAIERNMPEKHDDQPKEVQPYLQPYLRPGRPYPAQSCLQ